MIQRMKQQTEEIQSVAFENLKYNAFALLPENVLYSMLKSEDDLEIWKTALQKILSVRCEQLAKKRLKKITAINTEATQWSQLISLSGSVSVNLRLIYQSYLHTPRVLKGLLSWHLTLLIMCMVLNQAQTHNCHRHKPPNEAIFCL